MYALDTDSQLKEFASSSHTAAKLPLEGGRSMTSKDKFWIVTSVWDRTTGPAPPQAMIFYLTVCANRAEIYLNRRTMLSRTVCDDQSDLLAVYGIFTVATVSASICGRCPFAM